MLSLRGWRGWHVLSVGVEGWRHVLSAGVEGWRHVLSVGVEGVEACFECGGGGGGMF